MSHGRLPGISDVMMSFLKLCSHFRNVHNKILQAGSHYNKVNWTLVQLILLLLTRKPLWKGFADSQVAHISEQIIFKITALLNYNLYT